MTSAPNPVFAPSEDSRGEIAEVAEALDTIRNDMRSVAAQGRPVLDRVQPSHRASAENLLHYLALRRRDLRSLQPRLAALGLSSLGRSEGRVMASLEAVRTAVRGLDAVGVAGERRVEDGASEQEALLVNTRTLLGPEPHERHVRIMVTMPTEAARDYALVHDLVRAGMDCMRINCAHDDAGVWQQMIENLNRANEALGRSCRVAMDLGGPKLRTGPIQAGPAVVRISPARDAYGRVTAAARVWLAAAEAQRPAPSESAATLPMPSAWIARLRTGDRLKLIDARGARRIMEVIDANTDGAWVLVSKTCYIVPGTKLRRAGVKGKSGLGVVGALEPREAPIRLCAGDTLVITRDLQPGGEATRDPNGQVLTPAHIGCTLAEVFDDVRPGERIWLDDGRIGGVIQTVEPDRVLVKIDRARAAGERLRGDKGINLPESRLRLAALTPKDIEDLAFVVRHAHIVSLSFVNRAADVEALQQHLQRLEGTHLGIILKIETRRGFEALPGILFAGLRSAGCGVMIARGDLAVECGFERMAELQEEILWICEAAHVPVVWATQVLEGLAKQGVPSRAEITDAAMSERAECVMLNKGPHVRQAVQVLDDILRRMQAHVTKKRSMLRELSLARRFFEPPTEESAG